MLSSPTRQLTQIRISYEAPEAALPEDGHRVTAAFVRTVDAMLCYGHIPLRKNRRD
jgi:hypothetical protein